MVPRFEVTVVQERGDPRADFARRVVVVSGELDVATSGRLRNAFSELLAVGHSELAVDMGGVEFMDASGVGVLVGAALEARARGGRLVLQRPSRAVRRVLDLVDLDGVLARED